MIMLVLSVRAVVGRWRSSMGGHDFTGQQFDSGSYYHDHSQASKPRKFEFQNTHQAMVDSERIKMLGADESQHMPVPKISQPYDD